MHSCSVGYLQMCSQRFVTIIKPNPMPSLYFQIRLDIVVVWWIHNCSTLSMDVLVKLGILCIMLVAVLCLKLHKHDWFKLDWHISTAVFYLKWEYISACNEGNYLCNTFLTFAAQSVLQGSKEWGGVTKTMHGKTNQGQECPLKKSI